MRLSREQRSELKKRLRRAPQYATANINLCTATVSELLRLASDWGVSVPTADEVAKPASASAAFDDLDTKDTDTKDTDGEDTGGESREDLLSAMKPALPVPAVSDILVKLGAGDFAGFQAALGQLHAAAVKPPVIQTKTVEKVVEKLVEKVVTVEVEAPADHLRPAHVPTVVGSTKLAGLVVDQWDAPDAPALDPLYKWPASTAVAVSKIKRGQPIFLTGPAGTGKTSFAEQVAAHQRRPFVRISCHEQTDGPTLVGMMVPDSAGGVKWQDGQLTKALRRAGTLILIDEPSTARPGAMMILQSVLEPGGKLHIETTGEVVRRAPGVSFILADNTAGHGDETGQYEATRRMNRATLDRMAATLTVDYLPRQSEIRVLKDRTGIDDKYAGLLVSFASVSRDGANKGSLTHGVGLRRLVSWAEAIVDGIDVAEAFAACVLNASAPDDREALRQLYTVHIGNKIS